MLVARFAEEGGKATKSWLSNIFEWIAENYIWYELSKGRIKEARELAARLAEKDPRFQYIVRFIDMWTKYLRDLKYATEASNLKELIDRLLVAYRDLTSIEDMFASAFHTVPKFIYDYAGQIAKTIELARKFEPIYRKVEEIRKEINSEIQKMSSILQERRESMWRRGIDLKIISEKLRKLADELVATCNEALEKLDELAKQIPEAKSLVNALKKQLKTAIENRKIVKFYADAAKAIGDYMVGVGSANVLWGEIKKIIEDWLNGRKLFKDIKNDLVSYLSELSTSIEILEKAIPELLEVSAVAQAIGGGEAIKKLGEAARTLYQKAKEYLSKIRKALHDVFQPLMESDIRLWGLTPLLQQMGVRIQLIKPTAPILSVLKTVSSTVMHVLDEFNEWAWREADGNTWKQALAALVSAGVALDQAFAFIPWSLLHGKELAQAFASGINAIWQALHGNTKPLMEGLREAYEAMFGTPARAALTIAGFLIPFIIPIDALRGLSAVERIALRILTGDLIGPVFEVAEAARPLEKVVYYIEKTEQGTRIMRNALEEVGEKEIEEAVARNLAERGLGGKLVKAIGKEILKGKPIFEALEEIKFPLLPEKALEILGTMQLAMKDLMTISKSALSKSLKELASISLDFFRFERAISKLIKGVRPTAETLEKVETTSERLGKMLEELITTEEQIEQKLPKELAQALRELIERNPELAVGKLRQFLDEAVVCLEHELPRLPKGAVEDLARALSHYKGSLTKLEEFLSKFARAEEDLAQLESVLEEAGISIPKLRSYAEKVEKLREEMRRAASLERIKAVMGEIEDLQKKVGDLIAGIRSGKSLEEALRGAGFHEDIIKKIVKAGEEKGLSGMVEELEKYLKSRYLDVRAEALDIAKKLIPIMRREIKKLSEKLGPAAKILEKSVGTLYRFEHVTEEALKQEAQKIVMEVRSIAKEIESIDKELAQRLEQYAERIAKGDWKALNEVFDALGESPTTLYYLGRLLERIGIELKYAKMPIVFPSDVLLPMKRYLMALREDLIRFAGDRAKRAVGLIDEIMDDLEKLKSGEKGALKSFVTHFKELEREIASLTKKDYPLLFSLAQRIKGLMSLVKGEKDKLLRLAADEIYRIIKSNEEGVGYVAVFTTRDYAIIAKPDAVAEVNQLLKGGIPRQIDVPGVGKVIVNIRGVKKQPNWFHYEAVVQFDNYKITVAKDFVYLPKEKKVAVAEHVFVDPRLKEDAARDIAVAAKAEAVIEGARKAIPSYFPAYIAFPNGAIMALGGLAGLLSRAYNAIEKEVLRSRVGRAEAIMVSAAKELEDYPIYSVPPSIAERFKIGNLKFLGVIPLGEGMYIPVYWGKPYDIVKWLEMLFSGWIRITLPSGKTITLPTINLHGKTVPVLFLWESVADLLKNFERVAALVKQAVYQIRRTLQITARGTVTTTESETRGVGGGGKGGGRGGGAGGIPIFLGKGAGVTFPGTAIGTLASVMQREVLHLI